MEKRYTFLFHYKIVYAFLTFVLNHVRTPVEKHVTFSFKKS